MSQHLRRLWSLFRVVLKTPFHEPDCFDARPWNNLLQRDLLMFRHGVHFTVGEPFCVRPIFIVRFPQNHRNFLKLVHFTGARKQRLKRIQLGHNTAKSENIDWVVVRARAKYIFRRSVPSCGDILGKRGRMSDLFNKAKIAEFYNGFLLDEHIFWLHISVEKAMSVDVVQRIRNLLYNVPDLFV